MIEDNLYSEQSFNDTFININFDEFLIQNNNNLVNSNEYYLQYKSEYLEKTTTNLVGWPCSNRWRCRHWPYLFL